MAIRCANWLLLVCLMLGDCIHVFAVGENMNLVAGAGRDQMESNGDTESTDTGISIGLVAPGDWGHTTNTAVITVC